eukprot:2391216-Rhodomonas_salina.1
MYTSGAAEAACANASRRARADAMSADAGKQASSGWMLSSKRHDVTLSSGTPSTEAARLLAETSSRTAALSASLPPLLLAAQSAAEPGCSAAPPPWAQLPLLSFKLSPHSGVLSSTFHLPSLPVSSAPLPSPHSKILSILLFWQKARGAKRKTITF